MPETIPSRSVSVDEDIDKGSNSSPETANIPLTDNNSLVSKGSVHF